MRRLVGLVGALVLVGVLGVLGSGPPLQAGSSVKLGNAAQGAPAAVAVRISPVGNDVTCVRNLATRPCATFNKAYSIARCGDTIEVAAGVYPGQTITEVASLSACSANVTFQPASGASVTLDYLVFGFCQGCWASNAADRVTVKGMTVTGNVNVWGDADNVVIDGIAGGSFLVQGASNVTVRNSDFGPCPSSPEVCSRFFILDGRNAGEPPTTNILIENNTIHDYLLTREGDHWECIFATGGTRVTIRGNRFDNCQTYAIALGENGYSEFDGWVIENNWFGRTCCFGTSDRASAIKFGEKSEISDIVIRNNTFLRGQGVVVEDGPPARNVLVERNILQFTGCVPGVRYRQNLFVGGRCSPDDRESVYGYQFDGTRLRLDAPRAEAVRAAFLSVDQGMTTRATARLLARKGFPPPPGSWNRVTVGRLLTDDFYLGRRLGRWSEHAPLVGGKRWRAVQKVLKNSPKS